MTVLGRYLAGAGRPEDLHPDPAEAPFDELADQDGSVRRGWLPLLRGLEEFTEGNLGAAQREVARLLADDGVTYTPSPLASVSIADPVPPAEPAKSPPALEPPRRWELDPLPLILDEREWAGLEAGIVQRAHLLDAILADLYGARRLLAGRHLPAAAVLDHAEYLRPVVGLAPGARQPLFLLAVDLGRDAHGQWKVISDRTQAPSGA